MEKKEKLKTPYGDFFEVYPCTMKCKISGEGRIFEGKKEEEIFNKSELFKLLSLSELFDNTRFSEEAGLALFSYNDSKIILYSDGRLKVRNVKNKEDFLRMVKMIERLSYPSLKKGKEGISYLDIIFSSEKARKEAEKFYTGKKEPEPFILENIFSDDFGNRNVMSSRDSISMGINALRQDSFERFKEHLEKASSYSVKGLVSGPEFLPALYFLFLSRKLKDIYTLWREIKRQRLSKKALVLMKETAGLLNSYSAEKEIELRKKLDNESLGLNQENKEEKKYDEVLSSLSELLKIY